MSRISSIANRLLRLRPRMEPEWNPTVTELRFRLTVLDQVIRQAQQDKDPRWEKLLPQQRRLNEMLVKKIREERAARGEPEPEPVTIAAKAARMTARKTST